MAPNSHRANKSPKFCILYHIKGNKRQGVGLKNRLSNVDQRELLRKKESSKRYLSNAMRWLETEEAINWIPDEIATSVLWAMEGWLLQRGIKPNFGNGWNSMKLQFFEIAPKALSQDAMRILSRATFLECELEGYFPRREDWSLEKWKKEAELCMTNVKKFLEAIEKNLAT